MTRRDLLIPTLLFAAACGGATTAGGGTSTPTPATPASAAAAHATALQLTPSTTRFVIRQEVHIQQDFAGLPPTIDLRYGLYLTAAVGAPADSGFPTTFTVDSIVVDSSSQLPPQINLGAARGYRVTGRLLPTGEFISGPCDTSAAAAGLGNLLPRFKNFFPRLPQGGVRPAMTWNDSTQVTDNASCSGGSTITTHSANQRSATTWEDRAGSRALRLEISANYRFNGTGDQGGQPFTIDGTGAGTGVQYLGADGRYLGGELRDSTSLTIDLPVQGISIPRRQLSHTTVTALPQ
jgi:hypothetical protein